MANSGYKGITRLDYKKKHMYGWYVRVAFQSQIYAKYISDAMYGGPKSAFREALRYRNEQERELGKPRTERVVPAISRRNRTGVVGVRLALRPSTRLWRLQWVGTGNERRQVKVRAPGKPKMSRIYVVDWCPEPHVLRRTSISIEKHGKARAFQMACDLRRRMEKAMHRANRTPNLKKQRVK